MSLKAPSRLLGIAALLLGLAAGPAPAQQTQAKPEPPQVAELLVRQLFTREPGAREAALGMLAARGKSDVVPGLIQAMRFMVDSGDEIDRTLQQLTGATVEDGWRGWFLWQEAHPEVEPFVGFDGFKADMMAALDENFRVFLYRGVAHEIRLEEIVWGGVVKDGIPALTNPTHITAAEADYLGDDDQVFGVALNGDARAYPLRIMDWHEMFNDVVGGVPVALAYCTLCGAGILYDARVPGRDAPFVFGSSGFLYRSNKLMYDQETHSLWNQFTGRPVVGPLTGSGIELTVLPVAITSWANWRERHPDTKVLSLDTGYARDYQPGRPYGEYFASPELMFPTLVPDKRLAPKDQVFVLRRGDRPKAWPLKAFAGGKVINDAELDVVLVGEAETHTVRAYDAGGHSFALDNNDAGALTADGARWRITEDALIGPDGARLPRLPGHIAYWFAQSGYFGDAPLHAE
jgi:hypothetical protein